MKFLTKFLILLALLQAFPGAAKPAQLSRLTVMSYNIRQGSANDGTNSWEFRYPATPPSRVPAAKAARYAKRQNWDAWTGMPNFPMRKKVK